MKTFASECGSNGGNFHNQLNNLDNLTFRRGEAFARRAA
jgi:hypothetical protein